MAEDNSKKYLDQAGLATYTTQLKTKLDETYSTIEYVAEYINNICSNTVETLICTDYTPSLKQGSYEIPASSLLAQIQKHCKMEVKLVLERDGVELERVFECSDMPPDSLFCGNWTYEKYDEDENLIDDYFSIYINDGNLYIYVYDNQWDSYVVKHVAYIKQHIKAFKIDSSNVDNIHYEVIDNVPLQLQQFEKRATYGLYSNQYASLIYGKKNLIAGMTLDPNNFKHSPFGTTGNVGRNSSSEKGEGVYFSNRVYAEGGTNSLGLKLKLEQKAYRLGFFNSSATSINDLTGLVVTVTDQDGNILYEKRFEEGDYQSTFHFNEHVFTPTTEYTYILFAGDTSIKKSANYFTIYEGQVVVIDYNDTMKHNVLSNIAYIDNDMPYDVTTDYQPVHKKYVDEAIDGVGFTLAEGTEDSPVVLNSLTAGVIYKVTGYYKFIETSERLSLTKPMYINIFTRNSTTYSYVKFNSTGTNPCGIYVVKLEDGTYTYNSLVRDAQVLTKTNTTEYTPISDYHPATKKYVDDNFVKNNELTEEEIDTIITKVFGE